MRLFFTCFSWVLLGFFLGEDNGILHGFLFVQLHGSSTRTSITREGGADGRTDGRIEEKRRNERKQERKKERKKHKMAPVPSIMID